MFCCCAAENPDTSAVVTVSNDQRPAAVDLLDAPAQPALAEPQAAAAEPAEEAKPVEEAKPEAEPEPKPEVEVLPPPPTTSAPAEAELPGPKGEYLGAAAWCPGECDACKAKVEKGSAVDINYESAAEYWRCPTCSGGQASEEAQRRAAEWKQAAANGHMPLTFLVAKRPRTVFASRRPLSLMFKKEIPVVVDKVDGHAKELGIEPGWNFAAIDGHVAGEEFHTFFCGFVQRMNALPGNYSLPLLFELPDAKRRCIVVPTRPLGLAFSKSLPAITNASNNLAKQLGVEVGWKLLRFGDRDVSEFQTFESFFETFKTYMAKLPEKTG